MMTTIRQSWAYRLGERVGHVWRRAGCFDRRAQAWLVAQGTPGGVAKAALWGAKIVLVGGVLYVAFWLILLAVAVVVAIWLARNMTGHEGEELDLADHAKHKKSIFYDPINYNDDPDPRFDDK